jgi:hypothetical protein
MLVRPQVSFEFSPAAAQLRWSTPEARQRYLRRRRTRAAQQRRRDAKKNKGNRRRCYRVWMFDSDVIALLDDVELKQDDQMTPRELREHFDQQWIKMAEDVIALAALSTINKNRK